MSEEDYLCLPGPMEARDILKKIETIEICGKVKRSIDSGKCLSVIPTTGRGSQFIECMQIVRLALEKSGWKVFEAQSVDAAEDHCKKEGFGCFYFCTGRTMIESTEKPFCRHFLDDKRTG